MADRQWTVKDLTEALKRFPQDAKVYYEMGPNGPGTVGKAQYIKAWGAERDECGVGPLGSSDNQHGKLGEAAGSNQWLNGTGREPVYGLGQQEEPAGCN